jgi:hypothetical protein
MRMIDDVAPSLVLDEVSTDEHDEYVEVLSTFPCVPAFPMFAAVCAQGLAGLRISDAESSNLRFKPAPFPMASKPRGDQRGKLKSEAEAKEKESEAAKGTAAKAHAEQRQKGCLVQQVGPRARGAQLLRAAGQPKDRPLAQMLFQNFQREPEFGNKRRPPLEAPQQQPPHLQQSQQVEFKTLRALLQ